jgi:hypothetical protein
MSAIAHLPGSAWTATHRTLVLFAAVAVVLLAAAVTAAVLLMTGDETAASTPGPLDSWTDTCVGAAADSAC